MQWTTRSPAESSSTSSCFLSRLDEIIFSSLGFLLFIPTILEYRSDHNSQIQIMSSAKLCNSTCSVSDGMTLLSTSLRNLFQARLRAVANNRRHSVTSLETLNNYRLDMSKQSIGCYCRGESK